MASEPTDDPSTPAAAQAEAELAAAAEAIDGEVVNDLPRVGDARMVQAIQMLSEHSGPLPSREWLTTVEQLNPGTTQALVADYLAEREHQRAIQRHAVDIDRESFRDFAEYQNRQLLAAFILVFLIAAGGIVLISTGNSVKGFATLIFELAVLAGVFIGRQVLQAKSKDDSRT